MNAADFDKLSDAEKEHFRLFMVKVPSLAHYLLVFTLITFELRLVPLPL